MSNHRLFICFIAFLLLSEVEGGHREYKKRYYFGRRHAKQVHRYVRTPLDCEAHEHFQRCGQEAHCDLSCDNFFTPPSCQTNYDNPKCYFPRCICEPGFVRHHEKCIRIQSCKKHYLRNYDEQF